MNEKELWKAYTDANPDYREAPYDAWCYGSAIPEVLARLTLDGIKTATASAYALYAAENSPLPTVGTHSVLLDTEENALCVLRNTAVTVLPFCEVPARQAYKEGEGDRSLDYWRDAHRKFFTPELKEIGAEFSEDMLVVCEEFEVVFRAPEDKTAKKPFVPDGFVPPAAYAADGLWFGRLSPDFLEADFEAVRTARAQIRRLYGITDPAAWPSDALTLEDDARDLARHAADFDANRAFAYTVFTADRKTCVGCVYIDPSTRFGWDAAVTLWGLDEARTEQIYRASRVMLAEKFPFRCAAYPGFEFPLDEFGNVW